MGTPTWDDDIAKLFSEPYWITDEKRQGVGQHWIKAMHHWSPVCPKELYLDLADKASVQYNVMTIYQHLRSRSMPLTDDPSQYWPEDAVETLRTWANQGFRQSASDPIKDQNVIAIPKDPPLRVRKDILKLTADELRTYREKLDTILQVSIPNSKWEELGMLHAEWCLHYQQATFFWHRAYLTYVESLIDFPLPYWNSFATDTSDPNSSNAGIPEIFLEEKYTNSSGEVRDNPLKCARAYQGHSKGNGGAFVKRDPILAKGRKPDDPAWVAKVQLFRTYHDQIADAFGKSMYSVAQDYGQGIMGLPWANLPAFTDHQNPDLYPEGVKQQYFDGNFELAHDNYHGWVGLDMADNTYTAFDPIFLSYHTNMDRIVEMYLRRNPQQQLAAAFPLQPFTDNGHGLDYANPQIYCYTTIGDMAKPSQARGYLYDLPANPDYIDITTSASSMRSRMKPVGGTSLPLQSAAPKHALPMHDSGTVSDTSSPSKQPSPKIIFAGVDCTPGSYQIDVFVKQSSSEAPLDANPVTNPAFIGRMTRLGMGPAGNARNGERCRKASIVRSIDATRHEQALKKSRGVTVVVTDLDSGSVVKETDWKKWPSFVPKVVWL